MNNRMNESKENNFKINKKIERIGKIIRKNKTMFVLC